LIGIIDGTKNRRLLRHFASYIPRKDNATLQLNKFTTLQQNMTWTEILAPIKNTEYFETLWQKVEK